jgi:hypothetical protein
MAEQCAVAVADVRLIGEVLTLASKAFGSNLGAVPGFGAALEACGRLEAAADMAMFADSVADGVSRLAQSDRRTYDAYTEAGFDEEQAFSILMVSVAMRASMTVAKMTGGPRD